MHNAIYPLLAIAVGTIVTLGLRAFPFVLFGNRQLPSVMQYLSYVLPPAIMTILVIYCLRNTNFTAFPFGLAEIIPCLVVVVLQAVKKNMYLSIIAGTIMYMILIRVL